MLPNRVHGVSNDHGARSKLGFASLTLLTYSFESSWPDVPNNRRTILKKTYEKPVFSKRGKLGAVTAVPVTLICFISPL